jgi:hypothetical protein
LLFAHVTVLKLLGGHFGDKGRGIVVYGAVYDALSWFPKVIIPTCLASKLVFPDKHHVMEFTTMRMSAPSSP